LDAAGQQLIWENAEPIDKLARAECGRAAIYGRVQASTIEASFSSTLSGRILE
jgi:hypothetical protein